MWVLEFLTFIGVAIILYFIYDSMKWLVARLDAIRAMWEITMSVIDDLNTKVGQLQATADALTTVGNSTVADIASISAKLADVSSQLAASKAASKDSDLAALATKLDSINTELSGVKDNLSGALPTSDQTTAQPPAQAATTQTDQTAPASAGPANPAP